MYTTTWRRTRALAVLTLPVVCLGVADITFSVSANATPVIDPNAVRLEAPWTVGMTRYPRTYENNTDDADGNLQNPPVWDGHCCPSVPNPSGQWGAIDFFNSSYRGSNVGTYNAAANWSDRRVRAAHNGVVSWTVKTCEESDGDVSDRPIVSSARVTDHFFGIQTRYTHMLPPDDVMDRAGVPTSTDDLASWAGYSEVGGLVKAGDVIGEVRDDDERDCDEADPHLHAGAYRDANWNRAFSSREGVDSRSQLYLDGQLAFSGSETPETFDDDDGVPWRRFYWGNAITSYPRMGIERQGDIDADTSPASDISSTYLGRSGSEQRLVTASRTSDANLSVRVWSVAGDREPSAEGSTLRAASVDDTALASSGPQTIASGGRSLVAVAVIDDGRLNLITYHVRADGSLTRKEVYSGEEATEVAVVHAPGSTYSPVSRFITALRTTAGGLKLQAWDVEFSSGEITQRGELSPSGSSRSIALTAQGEFVVSASRAASTVLLRSWQVSDAGEITAAGSAVLSGARSGLAVAPYYPSGVVTTGLTSSGKFSLETWSVSDSDGSFVAENSIRVGTASETATDSTGGNLAFSAVRVRESEFGSAMNGRLRVFYWDITSAGEIGAINYGHDVVAGRVGELSVTALGSTGRFVTAVRLTSTSDLRLIAWRLPVIS